jgi:hypothetical protein
MKRVHWSEHGLALAVFGLTLSVAIRTMAPIATGAASDDLVAACTTLGASHPNGYPVFAILGHFWLTLPLPGTSIYRLGLFRAFCASLSAVVFFQVALLLLRRSNGLISRAVAPPPRSGLPGRDGVRPAPILVLPKKPPFPDSVVLTVAFGVALSYGFTRTARMHAAALDVTPLHLLLALAAIQLSLKAVWTNPVRTREYVAAAFALGLTLALQRMALYLVPAFAILFILHAGLRGPGWRLMARMAVAFFIGLIPCLVPPYAAEGFPYQRASLFGLGGPHGVWPWLATFDGEGRTLQVPPVALWLEHLSIFVRVMPPQLAWAVLPPAMIGLATAGRKIPKIAWFLTALIVGCLAAVAAYGRMGDDLCFAMVTAGLLWAMALGVLALARIWKPIAVAALLVPAASLLLSFRVDGRPHVHLAHRTEHRPPSEHPPRHGTRP